MNRILKIGAVFFIVLVSCPAFSQRTNELAPGYYVVVAAYASTREDAAQRYKETLNRAGIQAEYGYNSSRKYYFVYLNYFKAFKPSLKEMQKVRQEGKFTDAWVRVVSGEVASTPVDTTPAPARPVEKKAEPDTAVVETKKELPVQSETKPETKPDTVTQRPPEDEIVVTDNAPIKQYEKITLENTEVFLSLYNAQNDRIVEGDVKVIDTDRARLLKEVKGNEYLTLPDPKSKSGQLTLICEAFGYRKIQHEINYPVPMSDTAKAYIDLLGTTFVVFFDLVRYHRGDVATLFHVYFYNDAAIMMPESKFELTTLLQMMKENLKYKIRLHGHTNGNYHGKIITMGPNKNFFSLDGSQSTVGSAKDLSFNRAEVIKEYLEANSIDPSRIEIKAWGGKKPLYDKHSANAKKNVRVEVEILED